MPEGLALAPCLTPSPLPLFAGLCGSTIGDWCEVV